MVKGGDELVVNSFWNLRNMGFENGVVPESWKSAVIVLVYKDKWERIESKTYRGTSLFNVAGILVQKLIYLRQMAEKAWEKKKRVRDCFRIESSVRQGCITSPWILDVYMDAMMKKVKKWRLPVSCMQITWLYVVSRRKT